MLENKLRRHIIRYILRVLPVFLYVSGKYTFTFGTFFISFSSTIPS